jgi:putative membrane protein
MRRVDFLATGMAAAIALLPALAWAQARSGDGPGSFYGWHDGGMMGGMMMGGGLIMMILFIAVIAVVVVLVVKWIGGPGHSHRPGATGPTGGEALDILRERFARGEIDAAEFEERKRLLAD